ncbi:MAG: hypothetical protein M1481_00280 [Candidatus Thermoplasmatota archaeon]|nr:hypothetical protein [Candidatus Thermoplasmatota archaeon]MCL5963893.1 hypothetical protein [Candidatus Thermoplasmatota archaeon]
MVKSEGTKATNHLSELPLLWEVKPNDIEEGYIDWVKQLESAGNFLVTWPWNHVKFIPLLAVEYLLKHEKHKMVILDDVNGTDSESDFEGQPDIHESFQKLIYFDEFPDMDELNDEIKSEMLTFGKSSIIKFGTMVKWTIRKNGSSLILTDVCDESITKCCNRKKGELVDIYGVNCIGSIKKKRLKDKEWHTESCSNGGFELIFEEIEGYAGQFKYDRTWLWRCILKSCNIKRPAKIIPTCVLSDRSNFCSKEDTRLFFINSSLDPEQIFARINEISPDLVIIPDADEFIKDKIIGGNKSRNLIDFLKCNTESIVIMFSTEKDVRHLYNLYGVPIKEGYNTVAHTCDTDIVLKNFTDHGKNSKYSNPLSSLWNELPPVRDVGSTDIQYVNVDVLDELDKIVKITSDLKSDLLKNDIKKFVAELKKSPLLLEGQCDDQVFKRRGSTMDSLTYEAILTFIKGKIADEKFEKLVEIIKEIYEIGNDEPSNPLMKHIVCTIKQILYSQENFVTLVVHPRDVKGTRHLLENMQNSLLVICSWRDLKDLEIPPDKKHIVIATCYPGIDNSIYNSKINEFIFIGSEINNKKTADIMENRISELKSRPVCILSDNDLAPEFLKKSMKSINTCCKEYIEDTYSDLIFESESEVGVEGGNRSDAGYIHHHKLIKAGENAILVVDGDLKGIFIPVDGVITVRKNGYIEEKEVDNNLKNLKNIEILIDHRGLHRSFKSIFIQVMTKYAGRIEFRKGLYRWDGFHELYESSTEWISALNDAIQKYAKKNDENFSTAENHFSNFLSGLNLNAGNSDYIKKWWSDYEYIIINDEKYSIYKIEHPKSIEDIQKIYNGINDNIPEMKLNIENGEKSYTASNLLQEFRRMLLNGKTVEVDPGLRHIHEQLNRELSNIARESSFFRINTAFIRKLKSDVEPFKVISNYNSYLQ